MWSFAPFRSDSTGSQGETVNPHPRFGALQQPFQNLPAEDLSYLRGLVVAPECEGEADVGAIASALDPFSTGPFSFVISLPAGPEFPPVTEFPESSLEFPVASEFPAGSARACPESDANGDSEARLRMSGVWKVQSSDPHVSWYVAWRSCQFEVVPRWI